MFFKSPRFFNPHSARVSLFVTDSFDFGFSKVSISSVDLNVLFNEIL